MKRVKQAVAVLVWCLVSVGCVAEEVKQPDPVIPEGYLHPDDGRLHTSPDPGEKIPVTYRLAMNKNKPLCSRVAKSLPQLDYDGVCDICAGSVDLFDGIEWADPTDSGNNPTAPRYTIIDIDNDGKPDSVAHLQTSHRSLFYYFLVAELGNDSGKGFENGALRERTESTRILRISSVDYHLDGFDEKPKTGTAEYQTSHDRYYIQPKNMMPFRFNEKTYIFMESSVSSQWRKGWKSWIVISQYIAGEFAGSYKPGIFEDQCYFEVIFNKPYIAPINNGEAQ